MNKYLKLFIVIAVTAFTFKTAVAQKKDSTYVGTVTGLLRDSLHNYVMQSATLSIYKVKDDELVSYQLTNNFGKFQFKQIPVGVPLRIVATYIGYKPTSADFTIPATTKLLELKTMSMERLDVSLKEVTITAKPPPMQMRGDTLEFNADAFKLDTNAVVEDLLRKLPGITIWADGVITVNGRKINQLLVEGKNFFGSNNKIALQNLPKNAVDKVQVYQDKQTKDPLNPPTTMNIVLKKDKKDGYFGKIGMGLGTDKRYAGDGMLSYFSPKTQLSVVGAINNVNKTAYDVATLIGFNSFKGEGIDNDYHSDFTRRGLNVFRSLGATYQRDLSKASDGRQDYQKENILKANYFFSDATNQVIEQTRTLESLGNNGQNLKTSNGTSKSDNYSQKADADHSKRLLHGELRSSYYFNYYNNSSFNTQVQTSVNDLTAASSQNYAQQDNVSRQTSNGGGIKLTTDRYYDPDKQKMKGHDLELGYNFEFNTGDGSSENITDFKASDVSQNKYFNRQYLTDWTSSTHTISTRINNLAYFFQKRTAYIRTDLRNTISFYNYDDHNNVGDLAGGTLYTPNTTLTNASHYYTIDERPGVNFSKSFTRGLDNRYNNTWNFNAFAETQVYAQNNRSQKDFQYVNRSYFYFIPSASISFQNNQVGESNTTTVLSYNTSVTYPNISQQAPLIDDANVYYITIGNINLKPSYKHELTLRYELYTTGAKNAANADASLSIGTIVDNIADSTVYDALGRTKRYFINSSGAKYTNFNGYFQKAFKVKNNQLQLSVYSNAGYTQYPSSVNNKYYQTQQSNAAVTGTLTYTYKGLLTTSAGESFRGNKTVQGDLNRYTYYTWSTSGNIAFALPKSIFFNTRVNFNNSKSSYANNIYYTIWNMDLGYRFLKGANAEVKFSALDLLHQNKSIVNYVSNNSITTGTVNVLQQYFMLTLAYYPRKFGLGKK